MLGNFGVAAVNQHESWVTDKRAINSKGNSVVLHEMYFDGMAPKAPGPADAIRAAVETRFGSIDKWAADFTASTKSAAGWAMLVKHPVNGKLYNVVSDERDVDGDPIGRDGHLRTRLLHRLPEPQVRVR